MVESIIGIRGKDFVLLAQDANTTKYGILNMKFDTNRLFKLSEHCAMLAAGEPGDVVQFAEYVGKNIQLYKMINGIELSPYACANFTRHEMATSLRSRNSFLANLVVGGYSTNERDKERAQLYSIDYLGAMVSANVVAHGFCQFFALGVGDRLWKEDLTVEEGLAMLQIIVNELGKRMAAYPHCVFVRVIDAQGIRVLDNMYPEKVLVAKPTELELQTSADMMDIHT
jgi:20S proteasome subunit beta 4